MNVSTEEGRVLNTGGLLHHDRLDLVNGLLPRLQHRRDILLDLGVVWRAES